MLRQVRLELARCPEFPEGSSSHGYDLALPLAADGQLDRDGFQKNRDAARVHRFWGVEEEAGMLRHGRRGWFLAFGTGDAEADEVIFKGDKHRFAEGEYISIAERDGVTRTFRVVSVK